MKNSTESLPEIELQEALAWCRSVAGPFEVLANHSKVHGNHESAIFEGYGRPLTPVAEQQRLVAYAEYALDAIVWGRDFAFYGFEREGHEALIHLKNWL